MIDQRLRELLCRRLLPQAEQVSEHAHHLGHLAVLVQGAVAVLNGQAQHGRYGGRIVLSIYDAMCIWNIYI